MVAKPLVQVACVCEKVLIEADGVPSLIRIVDTYTLNVTEDEPLPEGAGVDLTAFVALRSGEVVGTFDVGLRLTNPLGTAAQIQKWKIVLNGGEHGANLRVNFVLAKPKEGLYWLDVLWAEEDDLLARIPFRLRFARRPDEKSESTEDATT